LIDRLKNAQYRVDFLQREVVRLTDGHYIGKVSPGSAVDVVVRLSEVYSGGDLNFDGREDALAVLIVEPGDGGVFNYLVVMIDQDGELQQVDQILLGDHVQVVAVQIQMSEFVVNLLRHKMDDAICCPSVETMERYRWDFELVKMEE
jgi:hypothetical protein